MMVGVAVGGADGRSLSASVDNEGFCVGGSQFFAQAVELVGLFGGPAVIGHHMAGALR